MPLIQSQTLDVATLPKHQLLWVYNALDAAVTYEVRDAILPNMDEVALRTYQFSLDLQVPVLAMMRKGIRVDQPQRAAALHDLTTKALFLQGRLDRMALEIWGKGLNPKSPKQVTDFFYGRLGLPPVMKRDKASGTRKPTTDRDALETLRGYFSASIFVNHILAIRELTKLAGTLRSELDSDGRMRTSFNIAGTETGRFSSSASADNSGTNLQNQTERVRRIYVADPGHKLGVFDLKTGESYAVGLKCKLLGFGDAYLRACTSGDLHTTVTKLVWPDLAWGTKPDKDVAKQLFYRHFTYRDMAKRGGHGTNYYGTPFTMAKHLKVDAKIMQAFQSAYFFAFPEIQQWHTWVAGEIQTTGQLTSIMGRRRQFFGRLRDDTTLREAIAYDPQSCIADYTNTWLLRVHRNVRCCSVLLQGHDALLVQFRENDEREVVERVIYEASQVRLGGDHADSLIIPVEAKTGWNWGNEDPKCKMHKDGNPAGLREYEGRDDRIYTEPTLLDQRFS